MQTGVYIVVLICEVEKMSEYVEKQDIIKTFDYENLPGGIMNLLERILDEIPPVDVRPVVFCKDCKHKGWVQEPCHGKSIDYCRILERPVDMMFFCACGEWKGGEDMKGEKDD